MKQLLNYLFVLFAFCLPLTTAGVSITFALIILLWIIDGKFSQKWHIVKTNPVALSIVFFTVLHIIGFIWTTNPINGFKTYLLLLIPVMITSLERKYIPHIFSSFIIAMTLSEVVSYSKILRHWDELSAIDPTQFAPFIGHITYNPFLAFTIVILIVFLIHKRANKKYKILMSLFIVTMTLNMFFTGGRAGQIVLFLLLTIVVIYYFQFQKMKMLVLLLTIPLLYTFFYITNPAFQTRTNLAVENIKNYHNDPNTSLGLRITFALNSWELFKEEPLIGHGSGSFEKAYEQINTERTPNIITTSNPHNNYLLIMVQFGIVGLIVFINIFYQQIRFFFTSPPDEYRVLRLILPVMFMVICLSDSYLFGHHTQAMFALFSGVLYRNET